MGSFRLLDVIWVWCRSSVLHVRPVSGCAPGSSGTLAMAKDPRGSCQLQHFQKLHEHLKADRDSICAHFCESVIPLIKDWLGRRVAGHGLESAVVQCWE